VVCLAHGKLMKLRNGPRRCGSDFQMTENMGDFQRVQVTFLDELLEVVLC